MTPREAHSHLGLEWPSTSTLVRQAYVKGLRLTKPDTDPVGFQRLRSAYEVLLEWLATGQAPLAEPGPPLPLAVDPWEDELQTIGPQPFNALRRARVLEAALAQFPARLDLLPRLIDEYFIAGIDDAGAEVVREVIKRMQFDSAPPAKQCVLACWRRLIHRSPTNLGNYYFLKVRPEGASLGDVLAVARWWLRMNEPFAAATVVSDELRTAARPLQRVDVELTIELSYQIAESGFVDAAHVLGAALLEAIPAADEARFRVWVEQKQKRRPSLQAPAQLVQAPEDADSVELRYTIPVRDEWAERISVLIGVSLVFVALGVALLIAYHRKS